MNSTLKNTFLILLIGFIPILSFSQNDTTKVVIKPTKIDTEITTKGNFQLNVSKNVKPVTDFNFNIENKVNPEAINNRLNQHKSTANTQNFLLETLPEDRDIIGKKYWKGKDVTHEKLKSSISLGTVRSTTKMVKIECRDHSYIDGDRIRIYLNEKVVSSNIGLKSNYYVLYLNLEKGYNRIDFQALNQGFSGPNTAEVILYDANGTIISAKDWNISTGETATLGVIIKN